MKQKTKEELQQEKKMTATAFLLIFPTLILAIIATFYSPVEISVICIVVALYQFLMLKKFLEDYYKHY